MKKVRRSLKSMVVIALSMAMLLESMPVEALASERNDVYLDEIEIPEEVLNGDFFYLGNTRISIPENGNANYLFKVARGGEATGESTALIKIADLTAKYGEDYVIAVHDGSEKVNNPGNNQSLMEIMENSDFEQTELADDETAAAALEEDEDGQEVVNEGINAALELLSEESGLSEKYHEGYLNGEETVSSDGVTIKDGSETISIGEENSENDPVQQARSMFTGIEGSSQRLYSEADTADIYQDLQSLADVMTGVVVGASVSLTFREGENEKYLEIIPQNNVRGDGDRMFYMVLGNPEGSTTNSAISTCAVTVMDDEESEASVVSFSEEVYVHEPGNDTVTVTVTREGGTNKVVSAKVKTTGEGTALAGRDYSEVERTLFFPFGVSSLTVDIPVRTAYFNGEKDFVLQLIPEGGCEAGLDLSRVTLQGTYGDGSLLAKEANEEVRADSPAGDEYTGDYEDLAPDGAAQVNTLSTKKLLSPISISKPSEHGNTDNLFKGKNYYDSQKKRWHLEWIAKSTGFLGIIEHLGGVGVAYKLSEESDPYWISGARVTWERTGSHADVRARLLNGWTNMSRYIQYPSGDLYSYKSKDNFGRQTVDLYPTSAAGNYDKAAPDRIRFENYSNCGDCNKLFIYAIEPILRPFQFNYRNSDPLKFYDENGNLTADDGTAVRAAITGGAAGQQVLYLGDSIAVSQLAGSNMQRYSRLTGLSVSPDGESYYKLDARSADGKSINYTLDKNGIMRMVSRMSERQFSKSLKKNTFVFGYANSYPTYSALYIRPEFEKIPVSVKLKNPYNFPVTFVIDKKEYYLSAKEEEEVGGFSLGDKFYASVLLDGTAGENYKASGINVKYKTSKADTSFRNADFNFVEGKPVYISGTGDNRLNYEELTLEPKLQAKTNRIVIRVRTSDLDKFDTSSGILKGNGTIAGEYTEFLYANPEQTVFGKMYPLPVKPKASNTVCRWFDNNTNRYYEGNTLYFTAGDEPSKNIINLYATNRRYDVKLSGTLKYMSYDLKTLKAGSVSALPAGGALVSASSASAVADDNGKFRTDSIPVHGSDAKDTVFIRYLVSVNGKPVVKETVLKDNRTEIDVSEAFSDGVSPVASDIFNGIRISAKYNTTSDYSVQDDYYLPIVESESVSFTVDIKPADYKVSYVDATGKVTEENKTEKPVKIQLLVYGSNNKLKGKYPYVTGTKDSLSGLYTFKKSVSLSQAEGSFTIMPGDMVYLRLVTDRLENKEKEDKKYDYVYSDIYTGYTFMAPTTFEAPIEQGIKSPIDICYKNLPFLKDTGMMLNFPYVKVGYTKTERGYRMYIGASATQVYDAMKGTHISTFVGDDGQYWGDLFTMKNPIESFKTGLKQAYDNVFKNTENMQTLKDTGSLGNPAWCFDLSVGVFFDFEFPNAAAEGPVKVVAPDYLFTGVGGFVSVSVGFKTAWYYIIPVVFIPAYIGIEIYATVMGFLGAQASGDAKITLNDTKKTKVDFDTALNKFTGSAQGTATVQINLGVGLCGTLGVRAVGNVYTIVNYTPSTKVRDYGIYVSLNAGITVDLFLSSIPLVFTLKDWKYGAFEDYDKIKGKPLQTITPDSSNGDPGIQTADTEFEFREGSGTDSVWYGCDTGTQEDINPDTSAFAPSADKTSVLVDNAYERPDSKLITLSNGTVVLAFIDSDNSKGKYQRTTLKLASYTNGKWSKPVPVSDDNTADFQPSICEMKDGKVMVAWVSTGSNNIDENTSTVDYFNSMEIFTAVATVTDDGITMDAPVRITNDRRKKTENGEEKLTGYYDCCPTVVCDMVSGDAMVYYIKSGKTTGRAAELANPYTNDCVICYMPYSYEGVSVDGKTEHWLFDYFYDGEISGDDASKQYLIENFGGQRFLDSPTFEGKDGDTQYYAIPDFTAIAYNELAVYAYSVDSDSSLDTDNDRELFLQVYDFKKHRTEYRIRLTEDDIADTMPQLFRSKRTSSEEGEDDATDTKLFWYRDSKDICYIDVSELVKYGIDEYGNLLPSREEDTTYASPSYVTIPSEDSHVQRQMADFVVTEDSNGSIYILWTEGENKAQEIFAISCLTTGRGYEEDEQMPGSGWSAPYQLTKDGYYNDEVAVTMSDEDLMVVHNRFKQALNIDAEGNIDENNPLIINDMKLMATVMEPCGAVFAEDIILNYVEDGEEDVIEAKLPIGGKTVNIDVDVANAGLTVAQGFKTTLSTVDGNGKETLIGTEITGETLRPSEHCIVEFDGYTLPENVAGLYFKAVTRELKEGDTYYDNSHQYNSEPFEVIGEYEFEDIITYQTDDGFHIAGLVANYGNGKAEADDYITVRLNGPYNMDLNYDKDDRILARISLGGLEAGESMMFDEPVEIAPSMLEEYGYIKTAVSVQRPEKIVSDPLVGETTRTLGDTEEVYFKTEMPLGLKVEPVNVGVGETAKPVVSDSLNTVFTDEDIIYSLDDDNDVAVIIDGSIYGLSEGVTTLRAEYCESGIVVTSKVVVGGSVDPKDIPKDKDIPEGLWYVIAGGSGDKCDEFKYTGKKISPDVRVYYGTKLLEKGKDYSVSYKNNIKAYTLKQGDAGFEASKAPTISIKGKGNYDGAETVYFTITPTDLYGSPDIYADDISVNHTGKELKPVPVVREGRKVLKNGRDYEIAYYKDGMTDELKSVKDLGEYDLVIRGKGNYTGAIYIDLTVVDKNKVKPVSSLKVDKIMPQLYTGKEIMPELTVMDGKKVLRADDSSLEYSETKCDYYVSYINNTDAGTGYAVILGNPDAGYAGSRRIDFKILGKSLKGSKVTGLASDYEYTGDPITLNEQLKKGEIKVTAKDGTVLKPYFGEGTPDPYSYTVSYVNNVKAGTATIIFKGEAGCTDSFKKTFKITKASLASANISVSIDDKAPYSRAGSKASVVVKNGSHTLRKDVDYTVSYRNNKKSGNTASAVIKGKGNYVDKYDKPLTFTVVKCNLSDLDFSASDVVFTNKPGIPRTKIELKDAGKKLREGKDYKLEYYYGSDIGEHKIGDKVEDSDVLQPGTVILVIAIAIDGTDYIGSGPATFRVVKNDIDKVKLKEKVKDKEYTGKEIKLTASDIKLEIPASSEEGGKTVNNWEIVETSYKNNIKKGTAAVMIRGLGNYGGTRIIKFRIVPRKFK